MKQKEAGQLLIIGLVAAIISFFLANVIFRPSAGSSQQVPQPPVLTTSFPDVYNDPLYTQIFNDRAIDPALPVEIGKSKNSNPFNGQ